MSLIRWFSAVGMLGLPQASAPIAFAFLALAITGETAGGAGLMLAMTIAQVVGAIPTTRLGKGLRPTHYLQILLAIRSLALIATAFVAYSGIPFHWLIPFILVAGSVNGAIHGYFRAILNQLTPLHRLPRALGIASTINEISFVLGPVLATGLATRSPILTVVVLGLVGLLPAVLIPHVKSTPVEPPLETLSPLITPSVLLWLGSAAAVSASIAAFEIGAVALALHFGHAPAMAILFTIPLCLAAVGGGVWVSVRNRTPSRMAVLYQSAVMAGAMVLAALQLSLELTMVSAAMIGLVLAPLGTHYSLVLDRLTPSQHRPEMFALLRTANALGVIVTSGTLTLLPISAGLWVVSTIMAALTLLLACAGAIGRL